MSKKHFCHIRFEREEYVDNAIFLSGTDALIKINRNYECGMVAIITINHSRFIPQGRQGPNTVTPISISKFVFNVVPHYGQGFNICQIDFFFKYSSWWAHWRPLEAENLVAKGQPSLDKNIDRLTMTYGALLWSES